MISDQEFMDTIACALGHGIPLGELADALSVSQPTIARWALGVSAPYRSARDVVARYLWEKYGQSVRRA